MCASVRLVGLVTLIPASLLLAVSFFVLFTIRKAGSQGLKAFGYVVVALLWLAAAVVLSGGIYILATGKHPMMPMMRGMMQMKQPMMQQHMMK